MPLTEEMIERYETADLVLIPKGENRQPVLDEIQSSGLEPPVFDGRCLHGSQRR